MRSSLSSGKRIHTHVPVRIAEDIARGFMTKSIEGKRVIHLTPAAAYSRPLCGVQGQLYDRFLVEGDPGSGTLADPLCARCSNLAEQQRGGKGVSAKTHGIL